MNAQEAPLWELDSDDGLAGMGSEQRMAYLQALDIPAELPPDAMLLLAVLRQAVVDYFGDDPVQQLDAALYFALSPDYKETLRLFNLSEGLLPLGVDLSEFRRKKRMNDDYQYDRLHLETLVRQLSGTQLKIVLTMGMMELPATTRTISLRCGLARATALGALEQMDTQGLVRREGEMRPQWSLPRPVKRLMDEIWGGENR
jgi:hypothetical protein